MVDEEDVEGGGDGVPLGSLIRFVLYVRGGLVVKTMVSPEVVFTVTVCASLLTVAVLPLGP